MTSLLRVDEIHTYYGQSHVLQGVSFESHEGEVVALLGRNGVGKTTTLRSIVSLTPVRSGSVTFMGRDITRQPVHAMAPSGIGYVPEDRRIFPNLTVEENLRVAAVTHRRTGPWSLERIYQYFPTLIERRRQQGGTLSGGEQQMLAIARALMCHPRILLLDEPSQGLAPVMVAKLEEIIGGIAREGVSVLLVEQNLRIPLQVAQRVYLMSKGRIVYRGEMQEFARDQAVKKQYLMV